MIAFRAVCCCNYQSRFAVPWFRLYSVACDAGYCTCEGYLAARRRNTGKPPTRSVVRSALYQGVVLFTPSPSTPAYHLAYSGHWIWPSNYHTPCIHLHDCITSWSHLVLQDIILCLTKAEWLRSRRALRDTELTSSWRPLLRQPGVLTTTIHQHYSRRRCVSKSPTAWDYSKGMWRSCRTTH